MRNIIIVGGGSAGWMTASYLNAVLNAESQTATAISVIESPKISRIGVGEATVPTIRHVLQTIGVDEASFMKASDATFKQAIRFDDWLRPGDGGYYHPFDRRNAGPVDRAGRSWLESARDVSFADMVSPQPAFCEAGLSPRMIGSKDYASPLPYAYHMDAEKFADFLCERATARGVTHYRDTVASVSRATHGDIESVSTEAGLSLKADLFIDCTGFAGVLIDRTLGGGWVEYSPWLLCDRAVTLRIPYEDYYPGRVAPFTTAKAMSAGWVWDIGLANRRGTGYVYSSVFLDDDAAERELRTHEGVHCAPLEARRIKFRVGRRAEPWLGNCVAIGLSGGFIEPLESTGLYLVEYAAVTLAEHFPRRADSAPPMRARFNAIMNQRYEEILDFVNLHYALTQRRDTPFWEAVAEDGRKTERLKEKLAFWAHKPPSQADFDDHLRLFSYQSYEHILYGMNFAPEMKTDRAATIPENLKAVAYAGRARLPGHADWLSRELGHSFPS